MTTLLTFTDAIGKNSIYVNPEHVVAVFTAADGEQAGKTIIGVINGNIVVEEDLIEVLGQIKAA